MREIVFRGKRVDNGEWVYGDLLTHEGRALNEVVIRDWGSKSQYFNVDPATVGQCTGLKDKNGKEIYKGDILKDLLNGSISAVEWQQSICCYTFDNYKRRLNSLDVKYCEVIGNIHDNPELLEQSSC